VKFIQRQNLVKFKQTQVGHMFVVCSLCLICIDKFADEQTTNAQRPLTPQDTTIVPIKQYVAQDVVKITA